MSTVVLVPGAWHTPNHYSEFTNALRALGHEVHVPHLPSWNGACPLNANLKTNSDFIRTYAESLASARRSIAVLMHSYGGQVGTNALVGLVNAETRAAEGLAGGVVGLVYIVAAALTEGRSMRDFVVEHGHGPLLDLALDFAEDRKCVSRDPRTLVVGGGRSAGETEAYIAGLQRWNGKGFDGKLKAYAWRDIRNVGYVHATLDMTIPVDYQKDYVQILRDGGCAVRTWELETGHCPTFTMFEEVAGIVNEFAGGK
ncbi:alpha/beta-hydrolase [Aspergillus pseudodeflectus]|uniref:Alpha/beta-hydrolase n=1 Tax=Aspergillus pseudodeflectus TaxID=176178 RepID=A0ABR4JIP5_9EURO